MAEYRYTDAYKSIKAPASLADKILNAKPAKKAFSYKGLISLVACVIIMASITPAYISFTNPSAGISTAMPLTARHIGNQIPIELKLERRSRLTVSNGVLEGYKGEHIKGDMTLIWNIETQEYEDCTLTVKDNFRTTVYSLSYDENNDSFSIIKN